MMNTPTSRFGALSPASLPQRKATPAQATQHLPFRVLQTGHAPAQLSLFLRPAKAPR